MNLRENISLAERTTLGVGGPARYYARCTLAELPDVVAFAENEFLPLFVLGGGTNLLVSDDGFDGLVLEVDEKNIQFNDEDDGTVLVRAGASVEWDELVEETVRAGLGGLECLSGIPGRAGAAPVQNVGAYGQEVAETIVSLDAFSVVDDEGARSIAGADCDFAYRWSRFKGEWQGCYAVTAVTFRLRRTDNGAVRYPELARRLEVREGGPAPPLAAVREAVLDIRRGKSMVLDPKDPNRRSAGSFFLNPVVTRAKADVVRRELGVDEMPEYPTDDGVKLSAAWLIEQSGFKRGDRCGGAGISSKHILALINTGKATADDIMTLAGSIRTAVLKVCGVVLEPEPFFLGFEGLG